MNVQKTNQKVIQIKQKPNNKRWTDSEIKKILEYMQENCEIERPTAQIYYRKLLLATNIDATWDIVRWKVKHLKTNYNKAESWRNSTGAGLLETDEGLSSVKDKLKKMCRFYEELHSIFGRKSSEFPFQTFDTDITFNSTVISEVENGSSFDICDNFKDSCIPEEVVVVYDKTPSPSSSQPNLSPAAASSPETQPVKRTTKNKAVQEFAAKLKKSAPKNALDQLSSIQGERNEFLKEKLEFEREKFRLEFASKEKKFTEDVLERKEKYELKKLELEKQERMERFEIEMKYKCNKEI